MDLTDAFRRKKVFITGGRGFIGSNLARALAELEADVPVVDSLVPEYGGILFNLSGFEGKIRVDVSDVRVGPRSGLERIFTYYRERWKQYV